MAKHSVIHVLSIYDGQTEEITAVHRLERFDEAAFRVQFAADMEIDPDLSERYSVGPDDASLILSMMTEVIEFEFTRFAYFVEAVRDDT
jgi:hypothetical protein